MCIRDRAWTKGEITRLATSYQLSDEDAVEVLTNPEKVLPQYLAKLHHNVLKEALGLVMQALPQQVTQIQTHLKASQTAEDQFFTLWPQLKGYEEQILSAGQVLQKINPKVKGKDAMVAIGKIVTQSLGLPDVPVNSEGTPSVAPVATPTISAPTPSPAPTFRPAGTHAVGAPVATNDNPFAMLSMDDD